VDWRVYSKGDGNGQRYEFKLRALEMIAHFIPTRENMTEWQQPIGDGQGNATRVYHKSVKAPLSKKMFCLVACFLIFSKKIKKQATKHYFISPPEAAKYL
jgi:hypothetical protein